MRWLDSITDTMDMNLSKLWEVVEDRRAWWATVHRVAKSWTRLSDFTMQVFHALFSTKELHSTAYCLLELLASKGDILILRPL